MVSKCYRISCRMCHDTPPTGNINVQDIERQYKTVSKWAEQYLESRVVEG